MSGLFKSSRDQGHEHAALLHFYCWLCLQYLHYGNSREQRSANKENSINSTNTRDLEESWHKQGDGCRVNKQI